MCRTFHVSWAAFRLCLFKIYALPIHAPLPSSPSWTIQKLHIPAQMNVKASKVGKQFHLFFPQIANRQVSGLIPLSQIRKFLSLCQSANCPPANFVWLIRKSQIHTFLRWASPLITNQTIFLPLRFIWAALVRMTADNFERLVYVKEMHTLTMRSQVADDIVQIWHREF